MNVPADEIIYRTLIEVAKQILERQEEKPEVIEKSA